MKKILLLIVVVVLCIIHLGCSDDNSNAPSTLAGSWELRYAFSPWTGDSIYHVGNGSGYRFTSDHYQIFSAGSLQSEGTYRVVRQMQAMTGREGYRLVFDENFESTPQFIEICHDTIRASFDAWDSPNETFVRYQLGSKIK